jgi:3-oxoacyl-[acyl-carrier-protein] synthase II
MKAFINGQSVISPQNTFTEERFPDVPVSYTGIRSLRCIEPQYSEFIDPMAARRMSRIIKMGVCSAMKCLRNAGIKNPDAIITGTGLGCIEDTTRFLASIYNNNEQLLNPTPFIQSTHNTVGASIALILKCNNYNNTYVHRGFSFESALTDALMLLGEGEADNILVGGLDEMTPELFAITDRLGFWKKEPVDNLSLKNYTGNGTIGGEGTAFFILSRNKNEKTTACIRSVNTFFNPAGIEEVESKLSKILAGDDETFIKPDLVLLGLNGDAGGDEIYENLNKSIFKDIPSAYYKHLCGEYDTSVSFAMALAAGIIRGQRVPGILSLKGSVTGAINKILIYNHLRNINHSAIVVTSC